MIFGNVDEKAGEFVCQTPFQRLVTQATVDVENWLEPRFSTVINFGEGFPPWNGFQEAEHPGMLGKNDLTACDEGKFQWNEQVDAEYHLPSMFIDGLSFENKVTESEQDLEEEDSSDILGSVSEAIEMLLEKFSKSSSLTPSERVLVRKSQIMQEKLDNATLFQPNLPEEVEDFLQLLNEFFSAEDELSLDVDPRWE